MNKLTVSAPGKLMLFGEHAVVYNRPCLVSAVDQHMQATVEFLESSEFMLEAPEVGVTGYKKLMSELGVGDVPKSVKFVEIAVKNFVEKYPLNTGLKVTTQSEFSSQYGFGSSSAVTVCMMKALSASTEKNLSNEELFDLSYKTVLDIQGRGSGFDVAAAIYGGTLFFLTNEKIIEPLTIQSLPLIVGYSGIKADTVTLMKQVQEKAEEAPDIVGGLYDIIGDIVGFAKLAIEKNDWQKVGELMNNNQELLSELGVSNKKLDAMIYAARAAGAYGAKLSGAGGGDCIIAIAPVDKVKQVKEAITHAEGQVIDIETNAEGVRIENE